jgi:hypothetical protein
MKTYKKIVNSVPDFGKNELRQSRNRKRWPQFISMKDESDEQKGKIAQVIIAILIILIGLNILNFFLNFYSACQQHLTPGIAGCH